jgi:hypothetical protein
MMGTNHYLTRVASGEDSSIFITSAGMGAQTPPALFLSIPEADCAETSTTPTNKSSASLNETTQHRKIMAERFTYHFVIAVWRTKDAAIRRRM